MFGGHPRRAGTGNGFTDVATGEFQTCGVRESDATVQCWGSNWSGTSQLAPPTDSGGGLISFYFIDSQRHHISGIRADNDEIVWWGRDNYGQASGAPPAGSSQFILNNSISFDYASIAFSHITVGQTHTCGVLKDGDDAGQIRCWGDNTDGNTAVPAAQSETVFKLIGGGANFTCGVIGTGVDEGEAVCWGTDFDRVVSDTPETDRFDEVSIGKHHACGIKTD